jgi:valyl-tRNA synthetase
MKPLAEQAKKAVESGEIEIVPKRFEKVYFHWMDNIRDWCISRQLWWGHRIPVWYKQEDQKSKIKNQNAVCGWNTNLVIGKKIIDEKIKDGTIHVGLKPPEGEGWVQDEDVLDTWFSSGLWPFSTLGWPDENAEDYKYFYPTTVMETGYDILFFWVARMIMMGLELTGKPPFKTVYLHGLVRDEHNRKFSKSLGNGIDPIDMSDKFGTDALRMSLVVGATAGNDIGIGESKIKGYRNFSNKIWNIARFVLTNLEEFKLQETNLKQISNYEFIGQDKKDIERLKEVIEKTTKYLDNFQFSRAGELLYDYTWHEFADKIIEGAKPRLQSEDQEDAKAALFKLLVILGSILKLLHPFVPFITETIWQKFPENLKDSQLLIAGNWPHKVNK